MKFLNVNSLFYFFIFLLLSNLIYSAPDIFASINEEDIFGNQKCFDNKNQKYSDSNKLTIYEVNNNSTKNTIFIQYKSVKKFVISESFDDDKSILYKDSSTSGSYYLNMNSAKSKYYITIENASNIHKICFSSFLEKGNLFIPNKSNRNIKKASYELLTSSQISYYINNKDYSQNTIFYGIRFDEKYLDKINKPKIIIEIGFINSERKNEKYYINEWFLQNKYFYAPFYAPKLKFNEKHIDVLICLNIEFKKDFINDELFTFDLELIDSEEISKEFNFNITSNKNNEIISPKIYYINIQKNIFEYDRDILFLNNDFKNIYINPFFASNFNISNENSVLIDKNFIDITKSFLRLEKYSKLSKIDLFVLILDEKCNNIGQNDYYFISFKFFGGYHDLIHYQENIEQSKLFNDEKNKMIVKMEHCRTQYFINYFKTENKKTDERILDIESAIGDMHLYYSNIIEGANLDDYFKKISNLCIHKFENSILSGEYNTLVTSCSNLEPVMTYIYAHKKNAIEDTISFINQKSLIYIEYNNQYSLQFNNKEKSNEFEFRIRILRTNIKGKYKIDITYESSALSLDNDKDNQIFKHKKNSDSNLKIKISSLSESEIENRGFILEIFKSIDMPEKEILIIDKEVEKDKLEMDKVYLFIYDKNEINSGKNKIELYNDNIANRKISICVHRGKGKYPFIIKPICLDEQENIILNPKENLTLSYNNPFNMKNLDDENNQYYVSILTDRPISFSYKYEREIFLEENHYLNLNHKGNKIFKLSKKINRKKSIYYQINLCGNRYQNSNLYYTFNKSKPIPIKNDIYQEFSIDSIKSFLVEFKSENENNIAQFKYFYGKSNLIKTVNNFSREISISKNSFDNKLLIKFETPFIELVEIKIILISNSYDKFENLCSFLKYSESFDSNNKTVKIFVEKIRIRESMKNKIEIGIEKSEIKDFINQKVDLYVISKSIESNLEMLYDVKSLLFDWQSLNNAENEIIKEKKNLICINCGLAGELDLNNETNQSNTKKEIWDNKNNDKNPNITDYNNNQYNKQKNNNDNNFNRDNNQYKNNNSNINDYNNNQYNTQKNNNDNYNRDNNQYYNNNSNYYNNNQNNRQNNNKDNYNKDNNQYNNRINIPFNQNNNNENYENNRNIRNDKNYNRNNNDSMINNSMNNNNNQNSNDNMNYNNRNDINQNNNSNLNYNNNQKNDINNKINQIFNNTENDENNIINKKKNNNNINTLNSDNINKNTINETINTNGLNKTTDEKDNTILNVTNTTINNSIEEEKEVPKKKKKSRKWLYFILIIIIGFSIYYYCSYCNSDTVNYSRISKYSYYDF